MVKQKRADKHIAKAAIELGLIRLIEAIGHDKPSEIVKGLLSAEVMIVA